MTNGPRRDRKRIVAPGLVASLGKMRRMLLSPTEHHQVPKAREGDFDCAIYRNGQREDFASLDDAHEAAGRERNGFVWIGLHQPLQEALDRIADRFDLHPLAVEDAVHAHQRPKVEVYGDSIFGVLKTVNYIDSKEVIDVGEIMLFVSDRFAVMVQHGPVDDVSDIRDAIEQRPEVLATGPIAVLWAVADRVIDGYEESINALTTDVEEIEEAVFDSNVVSPTERIYKLKREILEFRRAVDPLDGALNPIVQGAVPMADEVVIPYFRDLHDHALRASSRLTAFDQLLSDILQANVAQVTLRQNEDMRRITAWAAILAAMTTIAGIYGMNFENIPELKWANGYYICLGFMATVSAGLFALFRHRRWL